jgi:tetratricopeptide (TPR) repeat protein
MTLGVFAALAGALVVAAPARPAETHATPRETFERGRTAFGRAEYKRAIEILNPLLYPEVLLDSEGEVVQAHRMLGVSYLFAGQAEEAKREFHKLLELRPDYRFDPLLDPQQVVDAFNTVVKDEEGEITAIESRRKQRDAEIAARLQREQRLHATTTVLRYERHSYLLNFVPFGAGQFQNDQRRKGWFFFGVEAGLAAISVGALATNFALYGANPYRKCLQSPPTAGPCPPEDIDHTQEDHSRALLGVQLVSGGLFFATAIWGVIDAVRHYQRDVLLPEPSPSPSPTGVRVGLTPLGLSVSF